MDDFDDDVIARTATEDEEAAAEASAVRLTRPALTMLSQEQLKKHPEGIVPVDVLVLGVTEASHILLNHFGQDGAVIGSVAHPACKSAGIRTGCLSNKSLGSTLRELSHEGGVLAVGTCPPLGIPEVAVSTARGILSVVKPKSIVIVTELCAQSLSKSSQQEMQYDFYYLGNSNVLGSSDGIQELPSGCTVTGMAAAVLSVSEARGIPAVAVVSVVHQAFTDITRKGLSGLAFQMSSTARACGSQADGSHLHQLLHGAALEAPLQAPWDAPRVYL